MARIRTFIALNITDRIRANASRMAERLAASGAGYNWVESANMHVTLNFVGDLPETEVPLFCREVKEIVVKHKKFGLMVTGLGAFPNLLQPRTIWLGVTEGRKELGEINSDIAELLHLWRFPKDRNDYLPHLTIGQVCRGGRWNDELVELLDRHGNHDAGWFQASEVIVYSSHLDRGGPTYTPMSRIKLK